MGVGAHTAMAGRGERCQLVAEFAASVEQFVRPVALHPILELAQMLRILEIRNRDLMGAPGPLHRLAVHELWSGPAFWRAEHDHGPPRPFHCAGAGPRRALDLADVR